MTNKTIPPGFPLCVAAEKGGEFPSYGPAGYASAFFASFFSQLMASSGLPESGFICSRTI